MPAKLTHPLQAGEGWDPSPMPRSNVSNTQLLSTFLVDASANLDELALLFPGACIGVRTTPPHAENHYLPQYNAALRFLARQRQTIIADWELMLLGATKFLKDSMHPDMAHSRPFAESIVHAAKLIAAYPGGT